MVWCRSPAGSRDSEEKCRNVVHAKMDHKSVQVSAAPRQLHDSHLRQWATPDPCSFTHRKDAVSEAVGETRACRARVCLSNMLLDWLSPRMAVTERFVHVGIRAGYRCWIIYWKKRKKSSSSLKVEDVYWLRNIWGMTKSQFNAAQ